MIDAELLSRPGYYFECRYTPTIMSGPVFRWSPPGSRFEVSASRDGVMVQGPCPCLTGDPLHRFLEITDFATTVHEWLASGKTAEETAQMIRGWYTEDDEDFDIDGTDND